jgi:hypothetical protein
MKRVSFKKIIDINPYSALRVEDSSSIEERDAWMAPLSVGELTDWLNLDTGNALWHKKDHD